MVQRSQVLDHINLIFKEFKNAENYNQGKMFLRDGPTNRAKVDATKFYISRA